MGLDKELDCQDWSIEENMCMVFFISQCNGKDCSARVPFPETCKKCKHFYEDLNEYCDNCKEYNNFLEKKIYYRKCKYWKCKEYFRADLQSLQGYCLKTAECKERNELFIKRIKKTRSFSLSLFDLYDLNLPLMITDMNGNKKLIGYERVCRICGNRLLKKDGTYSPHFRYCKEHKGWGYKLFDKYNWSRCSKSYAHKVSKLQVDEIIKVVSPRIKGEKSLEKINNITHNFVLCEECGKLCTVYEYRWTPNIKLWNLDQLIISFEDIELPNIFVHHKKPVYTLTYENIHLIFDFDNLICLCQVCHKSHHKSRISTIKDRLNIRSLEEFL